MLTLLAALPLLPVLILALLATLPRLASAQTATAPNALTATQRSEDFDAFCRFVTNSYAYFDRKSIDWQKTCVANAAQARDAPDRAAFILTLEAALVELYDSHAHLATSTAHSRRLVPTATDVLGIWSGERALVAAVRPDSAAQRAGLMEGDEILAINDQPVAAAVAEFTPRFQPVPSAQAHDWALQVALAGRRDNPVMRLDIRRATGSQPLMQHLTYAPAESRPTQLISSRTDGAVAIVRINNALGEQKLVADFDAALDAVPNARGLILDLRDTPSGGNTAVARGIMSRLVDQPVAYQRHEDVGEFRSTGTRRIWVEYVAPRGRRFPGPVVVLVGGWTGSMGEGLAIGLNAARSATVIGQPMARLVGALGEYTLPHSRITVRIPTQKLFHVDGTPREDFVPVAVNRTHAGATGGDAELAQALALIRPLLP